MSINELVLAGAVKLQVHASSVVPSAITPKCDWANTLNGSSGGNPFVNIVEELWGLEQAYLPLVALAFLIVTGFVIWTAKRSKIIMGLLIIVGVIILLPAAVGLLQNMGGAQTCSVN